MEKVGIMRIHDFPLTESCAIGALAEVVDGLCLLFHNVSEERYERLRAHPSCLASVRYEERYSTSGTLLAAIIAAQELEPEFLICFDEDELPPTRFTEQFEAFKQSDRASIAIRNFECWGSTENIISDLCYVAKPHCHAMRWDKDIALGSYKTADFFNYYRRRPVYHCEFPLRHLAFMTPRLRQRRITRGLTAKYKTHWRREAEGPGAWALWDHDTVPYDPNMTWTTYHHFAKENARHRSKQRVQNS